MSPMRTCFSCWKAPSWMTSIWAMLPLTPIFARLSEKLFNNSKALWGAGSPEGMRMTRWSGKSCAIFVKLWVTLVFPSCSDKLYTPWSD